MSALAYQSALVSLSILRLFFPQLLIFGILMCLFALELCPPAGKPKNASVYAEKTVQIRPFPDRSH